MLRLLLATISVFSLSACPVDAVPDDEGDGGDDGGKGDDGSDGSDGGGRDPAALSVPEFMAALGKRTCDDSFACMSTYPANAPITFEQLVGSNPQACYARAADYPYNAMAVLASISAGKITFDGVAAAACITGITAPVCSSLWSDGPDFPEVCDRALVGTVADGAACTIDFECTSKKSFCEPSTRKCARRIGTR